MDKAEKELLLSVARLLRSHLGDHINDNYKYNSFDAMLIHNELKMLRLALKPFESTVVELHPDKEKQDAQPS